MRREHESTNVRLSRQIAQPNRPPMLLAEPGADENGQIHSKILTVMAVVANRKSLL